MSRTGCETGRASARRRRRASAAARSPLRSSSPGYGDTLLDPFEKIGKERVGRHAQQRIEIEDQHAALAARGNRAEMDAVKIPGLVGLHAIERVAHRKRQSDMRQREDAEREGKRK